MNGGLKWPSYLAGRSWRMVLAAIVACALAAFQLWTGLSGGLDAYMQRAVHLGLGLVLVFLVFPQTSKKDKKLSTWLLGLDMLLVVGTIAITSYILIAYPWITTSRFMLVSELSLIEKILGVFLIIAVIEGVRRVVGKAMTLVVMLFLIYPLIGLYLPGIFHTSSIGWTDLVDLMFLTPEGVYGIPLGVSSREIALFVMFAAFIVKTNAAQLMFDAASSLFGRSRGGPAKVAVVSSALMGMFSGSGTANAVAIGSVTIPMMKRAGYRPVFAGAVEAVSSTGGQIMPPVMGAAAFVMASFTGISYSTIIRYAVGPAVLYYLALFIATHLEAGKHDLGGGQAERTVLASAKLYGHMVVPILVLVGLLVMGYSPVLSAAYALIAVVVLSMFRSSTRLNLTGILQAAEAGARGMLIVITATAGAGIIVGSVNITGLGNRLGPAVMSLAGGHLLVGLLLSMVVAIILGMGMPTSPAYIVLATFMAPAVVGMGLPLYSSHLFMFYFACLSLITPPVAITAYAAAAIAGSDAMRTGFLAFRLAIPGFMIPFFFIYHPGIMLVGEWWQVLLDFAMAVVAAFAATAGTIGFCKRPLSLAERGVFFASSVGFLFPGVIVPLVGVALLAVMATRLYGLRPVRREYPS